MNCVISSFFVQLAFWVGADDIVDKVVEGAASIFEDAYSFMDMKFREAMADHVIEVLKTMIDLLTKGLSSGSGEIAPDGSEIASSSGLYSVVHNLIITHPVNYPNASDSIWEKITNISTQLIVPIATTFIAIIAVYDLYQMVVVSNGMHDFDSSIFIRWIIKTQIALTLTANAFPITQWIFQIGSTIAFNTDTWLSSLSGSVTLGDTLKETLMKYSVGKLALTWLLSWVTVAAIFLMFAVIVVGLMGRLIEMYMYLAISPISLATLMNNETKGIGDSWVRGALGLSFQVFFIIIALMIFGGLFGGTLSNLANGTDIVWSFVTLCAYSITLIITILRSGQISKGMFGAH